MSSSNASTQLILVKARSYIEDDPCHFAIFSISPEIRNLLRTNSIVEGRVYGKRGVFPGFGDDRFICEFYRAGKFLNKREILGILNDNDWAFINLTAEGLDELEMPEASIHRFIIEIANSTLQFKAFSILGQLETFPIQLSDLKYPY